MRREERKDDFGSRVSRSAKSIRACTARSSSIWAGRCTAAFTSRAIRRRTSRASARDVLELVRALGVPVVRYPGGNFVSGFNWEDSVGPESRPRRLDLAWFTTETNEVGMHEFCDWCKKANTSPCMPINLGTRGPESARNVVEYANHPGGSKLLATCASQNGAKGAVRTSGCGAWATRWTARGRWAARRPMNTAASRNEAAKMMKWVDPSIELVACGSSSSEMPTFGDWELTDARWSATINVDYVSLHRYYGNPDQRHARLPGPRRWIWTTSSRTVVSICDAVKGKKHSQKDGQPVLRRVERLVPFQRAGQGDLEARPLGTARCRILEDIYNFEDALLVRLHAA